MTEISMEKSSIPGHYAGLYRLLIRFAVIMIFVGLLVGFAIQESFRKLPLSIKIPAGIHLEAIYNPSVVHGHLLLLGVLIPVALMVLLQMTLILGGKPVSPKVIRWATRFYLPGTILSLLLQIYRGYFYLISARLLSEGNGITPYDLLQVQHNFYLGVPALFYVLYGVSHSAMSLGLVIFAVNIWKSLPKPSV